VSTNRWGSFARDRIKNFLQKVVDNPDAFVQFCPTQSDILSLGQINLKKLGPVGTQLELDRNAAEGAHEGLNKTLALLIENGQAQPKASQAHIMMTIVITLQQVHAAVEFEFPMCHQRCSTANTKFDTKYLLDLKDIIILLFYNRTTPKIEQKLVTCPASYKRTLGKHTGKCLDSHDLRAAREILVLLARTSHYFLFTLGSEMFPISAIRSASAGSVVSATKFFSHTAFQQVHDLLKNRYSSVYHSYEFEALSKLFTVKHFDILQVIHTLKFDKDCGDHTFF
jgi:hypothetical protein